MKRGVRWTGAQDEMVARKGTAEVVESAGEGGGGDGKGGEKQSNRLGAMTKSTGTPFVQIARGRHETIPN